ncbi:hypothetical protein VKT23_003039 [Stygiomarasmius scandens]|uniref:Uncharacterized protein n=1 Tax=Marasmiellus scandens TaxID=2682957 RepID=A0ABR1JWS8_9AGAR
MPHNPRKHPCQTVTNIIEQEEKEKRGKRQYRMAKARRHQQGVALLPGHMEQDEELLLSDVDSKDDESVDRTTVIPALSGARQDYYHDIAIDVHFIESKGPINEDQGLFLSTDYHHGTIDSTKHPLNTQNLEPLAPPRQQPNPTEEEDEANEEDKEYDRRIDEEHGLDWDKEANEYAPEELLDDFGEDMAGLDDELDCSLSLDNLMEGEFLQEMDEYKLELSLSLSGLISPLVLSEDELAILCHFSLKLKSNMADEAFNMLPYAFPDTHVQSWKSNQKCVENMAHLQPEVYDCCVNSSLVNILRTRYVCTATSLESVLTESLARPSPTSHSFLVSLGTTRVSL